ncbi:MAG: hypothetical protein WDO06_04470 [Actinomycetota bacterium]
MSVELLTEDTVVEYLISKGVVTGDEEPVVEVLTGGISNVVFGDHNAQAKISFETSSC